MAIKKLSFEEKQKRLVQLFYETREFFTLKELEKLAPKEKGIVQQTVKEVLDSVVADGLVNAEKIGISNFYWSFPSQGLQVRKRKIEDLEREIQVLSDKKNHYISEITAATCGREETKERLEKLKEFEKLKKTNNEFQQELQKYKDNDPKVLQDKENDAKNALTAANQWTDNIFSIQSFASKKYNMESKDFFKAFGISEDFDYLE